MKKTLALMAGVFALVLVAVPALAREPKHEPSRTTITNAVVLQNDSVAVANSGLNYQSGTGTLRTGTAYADSYNLNSVNIGVAGCCEQQETSCCGSDGGDQSRSNQSIANMVLVDNDSLALANSGANLQTIGMQKPTRHGPPSTSTGSLTTGNVQSVSTNENYVNVSVLGM
jgi:hypothetical protein